jgi:ABC-2 type transport system permease protein
MVRIIYIFWNEYWGNITRRSYLIFTFGFPIFLVGAPIIGGLILALAIRAAMPPADPRPIGVVDQAGLFSDVETYPNDPVAVRLFANPEQAAAALSAGDIQAYYDVQPDYWQSGEVILSYEVPPSQMVDGMFSGWVQTQVQARVPPDILARFDQGPDIIHQNLTGARTFAAGNIITPIIIYLLVYFVRFGSSVTASYMFDSMAREADERTMEILITTVTPLQLVTAKLLGLMAVGLTQLGMWGGAALILGLGISYLLGFDLLAFLLSWEHLGLLASVLLATYVLDQVLAAAMGLFRVSGGAGNMFFDTVNLVVGIGLLYAAYFVPRNPHAPLAIIASFIPFTASVVLPIRVVVSEVPTWQIILSQAILWGTSLAGLFWLRQLLRANLVAYGPPFSLRRWLKRFDFGLFDFRF